MPFDLKVDKAPIAVDPDLSQTVKPQRPPPGTPTSGPNRHTTFVPSENTTFSLGQKAPERINDVGITGRTDNHVHFHVQTNDKTVVTLGGPATEVVIDAHDPSVPSKSNGYAMVTDKNAWHDSNLQHFIVSRTEDVVIRVAAGGGAAGTAAAAAGGALAGAAGAHGGGGGAGGGGEKTLLLQSDHGNITAAAGKVITVGAQKQVKIIADPLAHFDDPGYTKVVNPKVKESFDLHDTKLALKLSDWTIALYSLLGSVVKINGKEPVWKKPEWKPETYMDVIKILADGAKLGTSIYNYVAHDEDPGKVSISAANSASISAMNSASMFAINSASVTSVISAGVFGGTASLKALTWASVWAGISSSVKGGMDASIEGEWGKAKVTGRKKVSVKSTTAEISVQAEKDLELTSKSTQASLWGKEKVYLGSGKGTGYGLKATPKSLRFGKITSADDYPSANLDNSWGVIIDDKQMEATFKDTKFTMMKTKVKLKCKADFELDSSSGKGIVKATKILLK